MRGPGKQQIEGYAALPFVEHVPSLFHDLVYFVSLARPIWVYATSRETAARLERGLYSPKRGQAPNGSTSLETASYRTSRTAFTGRRTGAVRQARPIAGAVVLTT